MIWMNSQLLKKSLETLPDAPGVYFFKDSDGNILYIGRATSLSDRVRSYFGDDLIETRGPLLVDMVTRSHKIDFTETDSVLEAIILESNLIKEHQPYFNTKEKDDKSYNYVVITDEEFPRVMLVRGRTLEMADKELRDITLDCKIKNQFGPYPQGSLLREALRIIRKIFPFRDEKSGISHQEKFYRSIGLSPDTTSPEAKKDYQKTIRNLTLFFQGKKSELVKTLEREMNDYAKTEQFEKADGVKKTLYALTHIQDVALIKKQNEGGSRTGFRVEAYDIAHMSGKNTVGVMVVGYDGEFDKNEYRKFKISKEANNDVGGLREILARRFSHPEWKFPELIVIDGGLGQINAAMETLQNLGITIPIVSVVKNDSHKADRILSQGSTGEALSKTHQEIIVKINAEAHRFAIAYHKNLRKRTFLRPTNRRK